ncbi:DUF4145 domain-containing protein [Sphingomonas agri]|uniref:DUF4145 domain-containing protein n=1 Tax=Sphingomonas agri TaxID=1813878 RepID=UPI00311FE6DB
MADRKHYVSPSIAETAFNCPHCGALTSQTWFNLHADRLDDKPLRLIGVDLQEEMLEDFESEEEKREGRKLFERLSAGTPFLERRESSTHVYWDFHNANVARCFHCDRVSVWLGNDLVWPATGDAPEANPDLSEDVRLDYDEAGRILSLSPRGAAALLRLAIQKLCKELGGNGKTIDEDIAELVRQGLDVRVQRALDIVRVIGNEAVHPGQVDLRDDRATAVKLFELVNIIADKMISQPRAIDALYEDLPESKRQAIERRDATKGEPHR